MTDNRNVFRRRRWLTVPFAGVIAAVVAVTTPALAASTENWASTSSTFRTTHGTTALVAADGASDGRAMKLTLQPNPSAGPGGGAEVSTNSGSYRYGTYSSRLKMADCSAGNRLGVVTGTFTYSTDHGDANGNGLPDNAEIDVEVLCAQPNVLWLTIWTDYRDADAAARKISRAIDMRTGRVLYNCYVHQLGSDCQPEQPGENSPAGVTPIPDYDSGKQFHTYTFDWQADHVTFSILGADGRQNVLWDYRGPADRIPDKAGLFMQNVWHTNNWDPLDGPGRNPPTTPIDVYLDSTVVP
jgi:beta-glucanase (GH16 family)